MASAREVISVLVALEFVLLGVFVLFIAPLESILGVIPLMLVFTVALVAYWR
ncbi:hypothetical protein [Haloarchaeobius sp. DFWS5]|uniref:hypothetical protein n=1 Tax=Haloarchaeobius sp. DFWS5 TaxID=3446114 RepID=UPI003EC0B969